MGNGQAQAGAAGIAVITGLLEGIKNSFLIICANADTAVNDTNG